MGQNGSHECLESVQSMIFIVCSKSFTSFTVKVSNIYTFIHWITKAHTGWVYVDIKTHHITSAGPLWKIRWSELPLRIMKSILFVYKIKVLERKSAGVVGIIFALKCAHLEKFEHGQYKEYLRSSFIKHDGGDYCFREFAVKVYAYIFHPYCFFLAVLAQTPTTTPLWDFYSCLPHSGSPLVELILRSLSCGFSSGGAQRTSWRLSWRDGADPGWRSAPPKWWECRKRTPDPDTRERCCIQSLWQCWGSLGALPVASSPERSAKWKHAFSCGKEEGGKMSVNGNLDASRQRLSEPRRKSHISVSHPFLEHSRQFVPPQNVSSYDF